tara:strand:- start:556 stop:660 length:105 start_codon:yes stop_codon:yes gene_type:complete
MKKKILNIAIKIYFVYSIVCDAVIIGGLGYLIFK